jgi:hypothetical protein
MPGRLGAGPGGVAACAIAIVESATSAVPDKRSRFNIKEILQLFGHGAPQSARAD